MGENSAMTILARDADSSDAKDISRLLHQLGYDVGPEEVSKRLALQTGAGGSDIVVAVDEGAIVGVISCSHAIPLLAEGGCYVRITALAVAEDQRGQGVGRVLVGEIERRANAIDASLIEVSSGRRAEREAAHSFYPALGFVDYSDGSVLYRKQLTV